MVLECPDSTLKEYSMALQAQYDVSLQEPAICKILKESDINRKVVVLSYLRRLIQDGGRGKRARSCSSGCMVSQIGQLPCFTACISRWVRLQLKIGTAHSWIWSKRRSYSYPRKVIESGKPHSSSGLHNRWPHCLQCLQRACIPGDVHWLSLTRSPTKMRKVSRTSISYCYGQLSNSSQRGMTPSLDSSNV